MITEDWLKGILLMIQALSIAIPISSIFSYSSCWGDHEVNWRGWFFEIGLWGLIIFVISTILLMVW